MLLLVPSFSQSWAVNNNHLTCYLHQVLPFLFSLLKSKTFSYLGHLENDPHFSQIYTTLKNNYKKSQKNIFMWPSKMCIKIYLSINK